MGSFLTNGSEGILRTVQAKVGAYEKVPTSQTINGAKRLWGLVRLLGFPTVALVVFLGRAERPVCRRIFLNCSRVASIG